MGYAIIADVTGSPTEEISIDGGPWQNMTTSGAIVELDNLASNIQIRMTGNGQSWTLSEVDVTLIPSSIPTHPLIDIDADGNPEWGVVLTSERLLGILVASPSSTNQIMFDLNLN